MHFILQASLFLFFIFVTNTEAYFAPICIKHGASCNLKDMPNIFGINYENFVGMEMVSRFVSKTFALLHPLRKLCAQLVALILDAIRDVLNLEESRPPPPTFLERIFRLIGWKKEEETHTMIDFNPGLMIYLLVIGCTIWLFVSSFYTKTKTEFEWPVRGGYIVNPALRQNMPYRQMCNNCIQNRVQ